MGINVKKIAMQATVLSELMNGKEKLETKDIIKYHPDKITIIDAERVSVTNDEGGEDEFYVYLIKEEPKKFAFAGFVLNKILDAILTECGGDINKFKAELAKGELTVKLTESKTKDGKKQITNVSVIE